jgi:hypothetical protein
MLADEPSMHDKNLNIVGQTLKISDCKRPETVVIYRSAVLYDIPSERESCLGFEIKLLIRSIGQIHTKENTTKTRYTLHTHTYGRIDIFVRGRIHTSISAKYLFGFINVHPSSNFFRCVLKQSGTSRRNKRNICEV